MEQLSKNEKIIFFVVLFISAIISICLVGKHRFHGDEALYASYAMDMAKSTSIYVDKPYFLAKPPIYFILSAFIYGLFPSGENYSYVVNIIAYIVSIYLVLLILLEYYKNKYISIIGAMLFALSPINILFSATTFLDTTMLMFLLFSLLFLLKNKFFLFGLFWGFACGTKQFALFWPPFFLLVILLKVYYKEMKDSINKIFLKSLYGFLIVFLFIFLWGVLNSIYHNKHPLFALGYYFADRSESYIFNIKDIFIRLNQWLYYANLIFFHNIIFIPIYISIVLNIIFFRKTNDILLIATILFLFITISFSNMPIYDRYILTFAPFIIMLSASSICNIFRIKSEKSLSVAVVILVILFLGLPIRQGVFKYKIKNLQGETFGAMYSRNDGIDVLANYILGSSKDVAAICMHRDISFVFDYYLYRAPAGYCWYHYHDYEEQVKNFKNILDNEKKRAYLLFYADNDEINKFLPFLQKYNLIAKEDYVVYNRFKNKNLVLYSINKK